MTIEVLCELRKIEMTENSVTDLVEFLGVVMDES